ncbi:MAG: nuclear transport factor 2 family protein [Panacagrimonas sp.]
MMSRWAPAALAAVLLMHVPLLSAAKPSETLDRFHRALRGNEPDKVLDALSKDAVIYEQGFAETSRDEWARKQLGPAIAFARDTDRRVIRRRAGEDDRAAWVISRTQTFVDVSDRKVMLEGAETAILRREGKQWKIVHLHWSAHEAGAEETAKALSGRSGQAAKEAAKKADKSRR